MANLVQCLNNINVEVDGEGLVRKYPELERKEYVGKEEFVRVMEREYKEKTAF